MKYLILLFFLSGCTCVYDAQWQQAESACKNNNGVDSVDAYILFAGTKIKCKNGASFDTRDMKDK